MKSLVIAAFLSVIVFASCKKDNDSTAPSKLSASFDGTGKNFNNSMVGSLISQDGSYGLQIAGFEGAAGSSDVLYLAIMSNSPIVPGTYYSGSGANITFDPQSGDQSSYSSDGTDTNPVSITITSISSTNVTGTFSGDIVSIDNSSVKKVLTNGQFNVTLVK